MKNNSLQLIVIIMFWYSGLSIAEYTECNLSNHETKIYNETLSLYTKKNLKKPTSSSEIYYIKIFGKMLPVPIKYRNIYVSKDNFGKYATITMTEKSDDGLNLAHGSLYARYIKNEDITTYRNRVRDKFVYQSSFNYNGYNVSKFLGKNSCIELRRIQKGDEVLFLLSGPRDLWKLMISNAIEIK